MTPIGIRTGRGFDSQTRIVSLTDATVVEVAPGDANRVAMCVALTAAGFTQLAANAVEVGPVINGSIQPLTTLSAGHPVCWLSVDKMGAAIFPALSARQSSGGAVTVGVTVVRQVQELP